MVMLIVSNLDLEFKNNLCLFQVRSLREKARALSVISQQSAKSVRSLSIRKPKELRMLLQEIWIQTKALCRPPHLKWTIITCTIQFGLTTRYEFPHLLYFITNQDISTIRSINCLFSLITNKITIWYSDITKNYSRKCLQLSCQKVRFARVVRKCFSSN